MTAASSNLFTQYLFFQLLGPSVSVRSSFEKKLESYDACRIMIYRVSVVSLEQKLWSFISEGASSLVEVSFRVVIC